MENIGIIIIVAIAVGILLYTKSKKKVSVLSETKDETNTVLIKQKDALAETQQSDELVIQMEMLPVEAVGDESKLVEITDSKVLAHVNNLVPGLAQAGNEVNNAAQAAKVNGEVLYRAIIPAGASVFTDFFEILQ
ncbi:MAG: hypothetical protein SOV36_05705 [Anaerostipes faecalis]|nr:hypothetical protein [Anaerostipes faecalis]